MKTVCGYVAIVGRPNVGKSTLMNYLVGEKLAGVSPKPQTTRGVIHGILTQPQGQIIFLDAPGYHKPHDALGRWMLHEVEKTLQSADLVYWMVLPEPLSNEEEMILGLIRKVKVPVFLLVGQVDRYPKPRILPVLEAYQKLCNFREIIPVSAKTGDQIDLLIEKTIENLPEGDMLFPEDQISDQHERLFVAEIIREKIFRFTGAEIPYATSVVIDDFKARTEKLTDIKATIYIERASQKAIVIGAKGAKLKEIGRSARIDIEKFLGQKVFLQLWVKVLPDWKDKDNLLKGLGYD